MKKLTIGIIAHVDSGKTTLSEALLYLTGTIRNFGRVDKGASFLDNNEMERRRGITIYSKQARFTRGDTQFTLIDTPGHADFSAEMERALQVLDYAILLISSADGIKGQTDTLWRLLSEYQIPVFLFVNKMDQEGADRTVLFHSIRTGLSQEAVDFSDYETDPEAFYDAAAMCSEESMEQFLETGTVEDELLRGLIAQRCLFPVFFGSALKQEGVAAFLDALDRFTLPVLYPEEFGARVCKILRDPDGSRLTMLKVTGGELKNKTLLPDGDGESKINQIRFYNGSRFELRETAQAGEICSVTGLKDSYAGQGFGAESGASVPLMIPILSYRVRLSGGMDPVKALPSFRILEEENPELSVMWDEEHHEIHVSVMGEVQLQILAALLKERFGISASFDSGEVMYKETIAQPAIGAGHFEPLRHYAEVQLLLEPLERGEGLVFDSRVSTDVLARNWQRLILTHLEERRHRGVLTGSPVTDLRITLISGKAHLKHTEGGDFRQAVYRAVRQGLMMAQSVLLEPFYRFVMEIPTANVGRAMTDLDQMKAQFGVPEQAEGAGAVTPGTGSVEMSVIRGRGPVAVLKDYPAEIAAYTKGLGRITLTNDGYDVCTDPDEVILRKGYDPAADVRNTPDSVFCAHGAGYIVPWNEVYSHMDIPLGASGEEEDSGAAADPSDAAAGVKKNTQDRGSIGREEVDAIIARISSSNSRDKKKGNQWKRKFGSGKAGAAQTAGSKGTGTDQKTAASGMKAPSGADRAKPGVFAMEEADYIVVDGYNVIFAWPELTDLARVNLDSARDALIDLLSRLKSMVSGQVIAVFDAYRLKGHATEQMRLQDVQLVYTAQEETADQYIEKFTNLHGRKSKIVVVTSDGLEQVITRGQGCMLVSSRDLRAYLERLSEDLRERFHLK